MTEPFLAHTATKLDHARGKVVVCGSHGGIYAGMVAAKAGVRAILLNDAGIGKDRAGVAGLDLLERYGIAAAALSSDSCRIGNADDSFARGVVSVANRKAAALGVRSGMQAVDAAHLFDRAEPVNPAVKDETEHRVVREGTRRLVIIDSAALIDPEADRGAVVITASHGGLVGNDPASAGRADAFFFAFNDAGIGRDEAGVSRLPVLEARGIGAVTVAAMSARIGVGQSTLDDGVISHANPAAATLGAEVGARLQPLAERLAGL